MSTIRTTLFGIVMLLYLVYPYYLIRQQENILEQGTTYRFRLQPIDPIDAFRGRYLVLSYGPTTLPSPEGLEEGERIFITISKDDAGFAYFDSVRLEAPADQAYLKTKAAHLSPEGVYFLLPENMERYYLNEKLAPLAEEVLRETARGEEENVPFEAYAQVRILNGTVLIEDLYVEGQLIGEYLKNW